MKGREKMKKLAGKLSQSVRALLLSIVFLGFMQIDTGAVEINWGTVAIDEINHFYSVFDSDGSTPLANGSVVQLILTGANGAIDPPNSTGQPTGDDTIIGTCAVGDGGFDEGWGFFSCNTTWAAGTINSGQFIYARAFNSDMDNATKYGDSYLREFSSDNGDDIVTLTFEATNELNLITTNEEFISPAAPLEPAPLIPDVPNPDLMMEPIIDPPADEPPADDPPPADPDETPEISDSDLGGATLPGMGGCGADGHLGFGFLPLFGICLLRRKNRS